MANQQPPVRGIVLDELRRLSGQCQNLHNRIYRWRGDFTDHVEGLESKMAEVRLALAAFAAFVAEMEQS